MREFPYCNVTSPADNTPVNGNNTIGSKAVAGIGIASVIHQIAIQAVVAAAARPGPSKVGRTGNTRGTKKAMGPSHRPMDLMTVLAEGRERFTSMHQPGFERHHFGARKGEDSRRRTKGRNRVGTDSKVI